MDGQKLVILGGGESGVGAALLGKAKGFDVFLSDRGGLKDKYRDELRQHSIDFEEGSHTEDRILQANLVVKSPGIPDTIPLIQALKAREIPVISEIEFAARYTTAKLIGITGSNGKTTTTLLIYHLLKTAGFKVGLAGNIGDSFAKAVINDTFDWFVLEISSFQLDTMYDTRLNIAVLLNITPDHLDRYGYSFQNYVASKFRILQNMQPGDDFIYFQESPAIVAKLANRSLAPNALPISLEQPVSPGGFFLNGELTAQNGEDCFTLPITDLPLKGPHNAINMLAAVLAAQSVGVSSEHIAEGLRTFQNAAHRLEPAGVVDGIAFINDSKATNVDSVFYALASMTTPTVWIAGGQDKGNEYSQLDELVGKKVKALICLGKDNATLVSHFSGMVPLIFETQSVTEAVQKGLNWATPGETVLLSPACASFDLFRNYEDRGEQFKDAIKNLK
ncbi:MAG: UDP-N-acetylmuramoyl-L-alanine--D-glutamate ligase [Rudanella sp.]|nr:UDP-N-acetylmuramoyl-L-alanine--D-glutamate ligase [Rudanella sp.]